MSDTSTSKQQRLISLILWFSFFFSTFIHPVVVFYHAANSEKNLHPPGHTDLVGYYLYAAIILFVVLPPLNRLLSQQVPSIIKNFILYALVESVSVAGLVCYFLENTANVPYILSGISLLTFLFLFPK